MIRTFRSLSLFPLTLTFFGLTFAFGDHSNPDGKGKQFLTPPPEYVEYFAFGFRESMADSFWLRWVQDSDTCMTYASSQKLTESHIGEENKWSREIRHKNCDNSWGFMMLDSVSRLAPKFKMVYLAGAPTLSILVEDFKGASAIYERGLKEYPQDWQLLYRASYHYQYDRKDLPRAAELLRRAGEHGAPEWVKSLASRLYSAAGKVELGIATLEEYRKTIDPENTEALKKVDERIAELKRKLQP
jgi:hypothetical protein